MELGSLPAFIHQACRLLAQWRVSFSKHVDVLSTRPAEGSWPPRSSLLGVARQLGFGAPSKPQGPTVRKVEDSSDPVTR